MDNFTYRVLDLCYKYDIQGSLYWSTCDGKVQFFINCNDLFFWACADLEEITPENIHILKQSLEDMAPLDDIYGPDLFCCRSRKTRPQKMIYNEFDDNKDIWKLFKECGPEREN
jgi:hypothetical protein